MQKIWDSVLTVWERDGSFTNMINYKAIVGDKYDTIHAGDKVKILSGLYKGSIGIVKSLGTGCDVNVEFGFGNLESIKDYEMVVVSRPKRKKSLLLLNCWKTLKSGVRNFLH